MEHAVGDAVSKSIQRSHQIWGRTIMAFDYDVYGPFEIPQTDRRNRVSKDDLKEKFWRDTVADEDEDLPYACGVYVFTVRAGKGALPWYVGSANRQTFQQECFQSHKLVYYNDILAARRGTPLLYLIPRLTDQRRFSRPSTSQAGHADIAFLEKLLIGFALSRNQDLCNIKDTKLHSQVTVPGILNSTRNSSLSAKSLKAVLGL
jgi:hypothetical protein